MLLGSGGGRSVRLWRCCLLSVPLGEQFVNWESRPQEGGGIAQAWATWPEGASAPNGTMMCRGHGVPEMVTPAMRTTAVLLGFLNLTNMPCSVLPWQAAWQVILMFKIIITLRRAQKIGDSGPYKNFDFLYNPLMTKVFCNFSRNLASF